MHRKLLAAAAATAVLLTTALVATPASAGEWAHWRGPQRNGTSPETGLIAGWSQAGENLIWRVDFVGRSTPVVTRGRVCANGRVGEDSQRQEMMACFDAETGAKLWERRWNVYHTSVPWNRVGWPSPVADPETGYVYVQGVGGLFFCFDSADGRIVWSRSFVDEFGFMEGYGGRTQTPLVDGERLIVTFSNTSWGGERTPLHRYRAFDKLTGALLWVSTPAPTQADKNTQSTPNLMWVDGRRLVVAGNGGGGIYAVEASTGEPVWGFRLSQRGINTSVVVDGTKVYASHSEENVDEGTMGRVVAIDGTGSGDVTASHELWRSPVSAGFASPALAGGRLYVIDNSANLHALDAATGDSAWELNLGRVGKGSPVVADGKLYATEVNGRFLIVEPGAESGRLLDLEEIRLEGENRFAEIYSSPAIAYGRIYFATEEGLYCLGDKSKPFGVSSDPQPAAPESPPPAGTPPARIRVVPAEVILRPGESTGFTVQAFDAKGRPLGPLTADWSLDGLAGMVSADGVLTAAAGSRQGLVVATAGELSAAGRVRVLQPLPLAEDFETTAAGAVPGYFMAYLMAWKVDEIDGNKVLVKGPAARKIDRHITFIGHPELAGYTIEADLRGSRTGRRMPDMGLINSGYTMELMGNHQQLQVRSWQSELRMMREIDFPWQPDVWYRMKLRVDAAGERAVIRGKVWPKDGEEPADWSIVVEDLLPIHQGAPGLSGYSPTDIHFDNLHVYGNQP